MTVEEVERDISLGEWRVNFQDMEVQLQVSLVGYTFKICHNIPGGGDLY